MALGGAAADDVAEARMTHTSSTTMSGAARPRQCFLARRPMVGDDTGLDVTSVSLMGAPAATKRESATASDRESARLQARIQSGGARG